MGKLISICSSLALLLLAGCTNSQPQSSPQTKQSTQRLEKILAETAPAEPDSSYLGKIDSNLQSLIADYLSGEDIKQSAQNYGLQVTENNEVLVDIYVNGSIDPAITQLTELGMLVQATNESFNVVEGLLPINNVLPVARLDTIKALLPVMASGTN